VEHPAVVRSGIREEMGKNQFMVTGLACKESVLIGTGSDVEVVRVYWGKGKLKSFLPHKEEEGESLNNPGEISLVCTKYPKK